MKKETIKTTGHYYSKDKDKIFTKISYHKSYTAEKVSFYFGWQHLLTKNSITSISLLMFLAEKMDENTNEVSHSATIIRKYIEFRVAAGMKECSVAVVRKGFQQLKKNNILIQTNEIGNYVVNPRCLFKGTEENRRRCINRLLESMKHADWSNSNVFKALGITYKDK
jgi:DNA-binding transcriptional regulator YhcF (GntR family)